MSLSMNVEVEGLDEVRRKLGSFEADAVLRPAMEAATALVAEEVRGNIRGRGLVRTGKLVGSIGSKITGSGAEMVGLVGTPVFYSRFLELGTKRGLRPRRMFKDTLGRVRETIQKVFSDAIRDWVKR